MNEKHNYNQTEIADKSEKITPFKKEGMYEISSFPKLIFKPETERTPNELASYEIAKLLKLPYIVKTGKKEIKLDGKKISGIVTEKINGTSFDELSDYAKLELKKGFILSQIKEIMIFDKLIDNYDRNTNNIFLEENRNNLKIIDNEYSLGAKEPGKFRYTNQNPLHEALKVYTDNPDIMKKIQVTSDFLNNFENLLQNRNKVYQILKEYNLLGKKEIEYKNFIERAVKIYDRLKQEKTSLT